MTQDLQMHLWLGCRLYNPEKGWGFVTSQEIPRLFFGKAGALRLRLS